MFKRLRNIWYLSGLDLNDRKNGKRLIDRLRNDKMAIIVSDYDPMDDFKK